MTARDRVIEFFGLNGEPEESDRIPPWQGRSRRTVWLVVALWLALALGAFVLLNARMPEDDGFGGLIPVWFASTIWVAGVYVTERMMLRGAVTP